jgi:hypothetical protein
MHAETRGASVDGRAAGADVGSRRSTEPGSKGDDVGSREDVVESISVARGSFDDVRLQFEAVAGSLPQAR